MPWLSFFLVVIKLSMCFVRYPALVLTYIGQASFFRKHHDDVGYLFFKSMPHEHAGCRIYFLFYFLVASFINSLGVGFLDCRCSILANVCCGYVNIYHYQSSHDSRDFLHYPTVTLSRVAFLLLNLCIHQLSMKDNVHS